MSHNQNPSNMIDGVPVKISERFKPPPKISIPQSVIQKLNGSKEYGQNADYDFSLERNVLLKISEWKAVRQREKYESQERLRLSEERRIRLMEEKQKQMLNEVSYPSTEDLSIDYDENTSESHESDIKQTIYNFPVNPVNFDTILTPTIVPGLNTSNQTNQNDSSSLTRCYIPIYKKTHTRNNSLNNKNKINYSDFENDTSSPFDNMELKTINDLDILAQVLNNTISLETKVDNTNNEIINSATIESETVSPETNDNNIIIDNNVDDVASAISPIPQTTLIIPTEPQGNIHYPLNHNQHSFPQQNFLNYYNGQFQNNIYHNYHHQPQQHLHRDLHHQQQLNFIQNSISHGASGNNYIDYQNSYYNPNNIHHPTTSNAYNAKCVQNTNDEKLKSKSVPDILKELNDNINDSEMKRIRNNSQTIQSK